MRLNAEIKNAAQAEQRGMGSMDSIPCNPDCSNPDITIAFGWGQLDKNWKNESLSWKDFVKRLRELRRTDETMDEYDAMTDAQKDAAKNGAAFVGGSVRNGRRLKENIEERSLITLDVDNGAGFFERYDPMLGGNCLDHIAFVIYSTHSHRPNKPRARLLALPDRAMSPDEHSAVSRRLAEWIGMHYLDKTTFDINRLMYLPSCSNDAESIFEFNEGYAVNVDAVLATYEDWTDVSSWSKHPEENDIAKARKSISTNAWEKPGWVGAWNEAHPLEECLAEYLSDYYGPTAYDDRWTWLRGSSWGGLRLYRDGHAYSEHASDPANDGHCHDSFDLMRIQLYGHLDDDASKYTNGKKRPSFQEMLKHAMNDQETIKSHTARGNEQFIKDLKEAEELETINPRMFFDDKKFIAQKLGDWFLHAYPAFMLDGTDFYVYQEGAYRYGLHLFREAVTGALGSEFTTQRIRNAEEYVRNKAKKVLRNELINTGPLLNVKNGIFNLKTLELTPHRSDFISIIQLPVNYDPEADTSAFDEFLRCTSPADTIPVIEEFFGYTLLPTMQYEKSLMLTGNGGNGKGTLLHVGVAVLGQANCSAVTPQDLSDNRFSTSDLYGKLANINADIPSRTIENSSKFKELVSGDLVRAEEKYKSSFQFNNRAKILVSANEAPLAKDNSNGFHRRWLIVPFNKPFTDRKLRKRLFTPEGLSGALLRFIQSAGRLIEQDGFSQSDTIDMMLHNYRLDSDTAHRFLEECCIYDEGVFVGKQMLYEAYKDMCFRHGNQPLSQTKFNKSVLAKYPGVTEDRNDSSGRRWKKIRLKSPSFLEDF